MKRFLTFFIIFVVGILTIVAPIVEAKTVDNFNEASETHTFAGGSGSGSGSGGGSGGGGSCGGFLTQDAVDIIREILGYFRILGPVILIVFIGLDFGGAILSQDNAALTKAGSKVVSRCIGVALLYFVPTLVRFILGLPGVQEAIVISDDPLCNTMNSPAIVEVMK